MKLGQTGVTMIEVLITIVVISFGLLALAMFQVGSLRHLSGTKQNMVVTNAVDSLADSIRANKANSLDYDGINTKEYNKSCAAADTTCKAFEHDVFEFKQTLEDSLADAEAVIKISNKMAIIEVKWVERKINSVIPSGESDGNDDRQVYRLQVRL